jgi:O-antigen ligase
VIKTQADGATVVGRNHDRHFRFGDDSRVDLIVLLIPTVIGMQGLNAQVSLLLTVLLTIAAFVRTTDSRYRVSFGPLAVLVSASAVVISRPPPGTPTVAAAFPILTLLFVGALVARIVATVDGRRIAVSLANGAGLYCFASVALYTVGIRGALSSARIGGLVESSGFARTLYPLSTSINTAPLLAAVFITSLPFVLARGNQLRAALQLLFFASAVMLLVTTRSTLAVLATVSLLALVIAFPSSTRWLSQSTALIAIPSVAILPAILSSTYVPVGLVQMLVPGRSISAESLVSIQGRGRIWSGSTQYWGEWVDVPQKILGFGTDGHYRSGASFTYADLIGHLTRSSYLSTMHNSYLQQLFDGGIVGLALLAIGIVWASVRLARRTAEWGNPGVSAVLMMTVLLLGSITEVSLSPGPGNALFLFLIVLAGLASQRSERPKCTNMGSGRPSAATSGLRGSCG